MFSPATRTDKGSTIVRADMDILNKQMKQYSKDGYDRVMFLRSCANTTIQDMLTKNHLNRELTWPQ